MKDESLYKVSLVASMVGLVLLFLFSYISDPETKEISDMGRDDIGSNVEVSGTVVDVNRHDGHLFIDLEDRESTIDVVLFRDNIQNMELDPETIEKGDDITVTGEVDMYERELQVVPHKLKVN